jgi:hypothetical protein
MGRQIGLIWGDGTIISGRGDDVRVEGWRVNMVEILCIHV